MSADEFLSDWMAPVWLTHNKHGHDTDDFWANGTISSYLILQVPPPQQHLPRPWLHRPENELAGELVDVKSSGWEGEHGYKHLPGEEGIFSVVSLTL